MHKKSDCVNCVLSAQRQIDKTFKDTTMTKKSNATALVLRCCQADMTSKNGFVWPQVGGVAKALDWRDNANCGHGLHGWLYGQGDYSTSDFASNPEAKWLVVQVEESTIRMLGGKCKFPEGRVVFVGAKSDAAEYIIANEPRAKNVAVIGRVALVGDTEPALAGALGTATAGNYGTATAGEYGTATTGKSGEIRIKYFDQSSDRSRTKIGYVGEDGIKPNTAYRLDKKHEFIEVEKQNA